VTHHRTAAMPPGLPPHTADQVEGRVLRVERDSLLVDRGGTPRAGAAQLVGGRRARPASGAVGRPGGRATSSDGGRRPDSLVHEVGSLEDREHVRLGDHLAVRGAERVEGRVLRVDRDGGAGRLRRVSRECSVTPGPR